MLDISTASLISEVKVVAEERKHIKLALLRQAKDNLNKLLATELPEYVLDSEVEAPQPPMAKIA